jgi:hypothetical protein
LRSRRPRHWNDENSIMTSGLPVEAPAAGGALQPKLVYLARRNPALSRAAFVARWRKHGALGMSRPRWRNIARYVHCDVLDPPAPTAAVDAGWDAIGLIWHRSIAARAAHLADTDSREQMERDELETFARPIVECCLLARECVLLAPGADTDATATATAIKLTRFLWAGDDPPALDQASDPAIAAARRAALAALGAAPRGQVLDLPLPPERGASWGLDCTAVEEWWFEDLTAADRAARWFAATTVAPRATTVLTNEVRLHSA